MNKQSSTSSNNPQIILAHGPAPDQPSIEQDSYVLTTKNVRQRTSSTENTKYMFNNHERSSLNRNAAAAGANQLTFQSSKFVGDNSYRHRYKCLIVRSSAEVATASTGIGECQLLEYDTEGHKHIWRVCYWGDFRQERREAVLFVVEAIQRARNDFTWR